MRYFIGSFWWGWEDGRANIKILSTTHHHVLWGGGGRQSSPPCQLATSPPIGLDIAEAETGQPLGSD